MTDFAPKSVAYLRDRGWYADLAGGKRGRFSHDLFRVVDVVALKDEDTLAVQVTSRGNIAPRVKKLEDSDALPYMRKAGWWVEVHGWDKLNGRWRVKVVDLS